MKINWKSIECDVKIKHSLSLHQAATRGCESFSIFWFRWDSLDLNARFLCVLSIYSGFLKRMSQYLTISKRRFQWNWWQTEYFHIKVNPSKEANFRVDERGFGIGNYDSRKICSLKCFHYHNNDVFFAMFFVFFSLRTIKCYNSEFLLTSAAGMSEN